MKARIRLIAAGLALCVMVPTTGAWAAEPAAASADNVAEARRHFQTGVQLYREGNGRAALVEMRRAYELSPTPRLLFNIGQAAMEANDYAAAYDSLKGYLDSKSSDLTEPRRREVEKELEELRQRVGFVTIETNLPGAEVVVDGVSVPGVVSGGTITLESGRHELSVVGTDGFSFERRVDVAARDTTLLRLYRPDAPTAAGAKPAAAGSATQSTSSASAPAAGPRSLRPWAWIGVAATGAFGATTIVCGLLTRRADDSHEKLLLSVPGDRNEIESSARRVDNSALATDIFLGVTAAAAATTITLFALEPSQQHKASGSRLKLQAGVGHAAVSGTF